MIFDEHEEMFQFYKEFARKVGFPVLKRSKRTNVDGITRSVTFACSKTGEHESRTQNQTKPHGTVKSGCNDYITRRMQASDNKWCISVVHLEHNHECNPNDARFMRCFRKVSGSLRQQVDLNDRAGISIRKFFNKDVLGFGGYEKTGCTLKDVRNAINEVRNLRLGDGDAMSL
ncbi:hypothetical protein MKW98_014336 [Papaver atlanticum]|uniref:FAR1 domain-containing protein n=1 Tax=Papaver atlanticum TaxID=357466 RepID=A0AAD4SQM0_9MAGN|nr:hypothetical protein MKW98_014336 [Papaver atlanticum]